MIIKWIKGILRHRSGRIAGAVCGVAITVSLLASIGSFISSSGAAMTQKAIKDIPVDWQVQAVPGADLNAITNTIGKTTGYSKLEQVGYANITGLEAATNGTVQTTGAGKVLGVSKDYGSAFPGEIRQLIGSSYGVLLAQQTAANLHAKVGDTVTIKRNGLSSVKVKVDGIVDLPNADSLFQAVGLPAGASPQAPPDNVIILPLNQWHELFDAQSVVRPDSIRMQLHVKIFHNFSSDPSKAYTYVSSLANNLEARIAGSGIVGDNLAARLDAVREDALYAKVLFLFLGLPGAMLAIFLTLIIASSGAKHRIQEQSILRTQGASLNQILRIESLESLIIAVLGIALGIILTFLTNQFIIRDFQPDPETMWTCLLISSFAGLLLSLIAVLYPAWNLARHATVLSAKSVRMSKKPLWRRLYIDILFLAVSGIIYWQAASTGYQVVLAPEGVTAISVNYMAFIAPFCLWIGGVLFAVRLCELFMEHGHMFITQLLRLISGKLSEMIAASLTREKGFLTRGIVLVALAVSFAVSTSIFNTTYNAQAHVDAELTNGSDVTINTTIPFSQNDQRLAKLKSLSNIAGKQLMQHRFAYVGNDLQDIYGIDANHISDATSISNAYFANGNAKATLAELASQKDGVLVSEETVKDFQLQPGDTINLRLQSDKDHQYHIVKFHFIGIAREFPTAPKDSFLVANADYIAQATSNNKYETLLLKTTINPEALAKQAKAILGTVGVTVTDLTSVQKTIDSSLTSVDLHGLTLLELIYALVLVAGSLGLVFGLGLAERRRNFAILQALGAKSKQMGAFIWSEGLLMLLAGGIIGMALGTGIAQMLVKVLTGVFDPPPEYLSIPWNYLVLLGFTAIAATLIAVYCIKALCRRPAVEEIRNF